MKKLLFILLIMILIGATGFGFGYVPLRLEPGEQALLFSKTSGWEEDVYQAGQFAWAWQLLIPTNASLYVFEDTVRDVRVESDSLLPSAELYAEYADGQADFRQRFSLRISYRAGASALQTAVPQGLRPGDLDQWYGRRDAQLETQAIRITTLELERFSERADAPPLTADQLSETLLTRLAERNPELEFLSLVVDTLELPDLVLYRAARETYLSVQDARREALVAAAQELAASRAESDQRIENLQRYGEVLSNFPVLLDYLEIAAQSGADPLDLTALQDLQAAAP